MLHALPIFAALLVQSASVTAAGTDSSSKERAQALLKEGSALYKSADFVGALQRFQAAYAIYPSPKLQFNIAQTDRELGRFVEAVEAFETFLVQEPDAAAEIVAEARQSLAELTRKLAQVRVEAIAGAQVMVDARSLGVTPIARIIWVTPGSHRIVVKHSSYLPGPLDVALAAGEVRTVTPKLVGVSEPPAGPASVAPAPGVVATTATPPTSPVENVIQTSLPASPKPGLLVHRPWYFWTAVTATAVFATGAVVAGRLADARFRELDSSCGMTSAGCSEDQIGGVKSRAAIANVLWVLAGASAVATGVTFFIDDREARASIALRF